MLTMFFCSQASNSASYIQDAFQLLMPILEISHIQRRAESSEQWPAGPLCHSRELTRLSNFVYKKNRLRQLLLLSGFQPQDESISRRGGEACLCQTVLTFFWHCRFIIVKPSRWTRWSAGLRRSASCVKQRATYCSPFGSHMYTIYFFFSLLIALLLITISILPRRTL